MDLTCEFGICPRCGESLNTDYTYDGECIEVDLTCPKCDSKVMVYKMEDEEDGRMEINDEGSSGYYGYDAICPHCGSYVVWQCDFMESDFTGEEVPLEEDKLVADCLCPHCGCSISIVYSNNENI